MSHLENKTAVLYFTRSADEEARAKKFSASGSFGCNKAIAQKLIDHSRKQVERSELPVQVFSSVRQDGETFGEKLSNAFQSLFDDGYQNVIAVGNDCPHLSSEMIRQAAHLLERSALVAGPATDGGTYLLGIRNEAFDAESFRRLAWQTDLLLDDFKRYAKRIGCDLKKLCTFSDIDNEEALHHFVQQARGADLYLRLVVLLVSILASSIYTYRKQKVAFLSHHLRLSLYHRGPPLS